MIPINNSDTAWLIVSDYNQDNLIGHPDSLRNDIANPAINQWDWDFKFIGPFTIGHDRLGTAFEFMGDVGSSYGSLVGDRLGSDENTSRVGGYLSVGSVGEF